MIRPPRLLAFGLWIALVRGAGGGEMPRVEPGAAGFSAAKLAALKPALEKVAADGSVAGGVVLIARHGKIAFCETFGSRDLATHAPMTEDAIFAVASMTKPITCVAAMTLVEQGKLGLDDPASKYLPELKDLRVMGEAKDDTPDALSTRARGPAGDDPRPVRRTPRASPMAGSSRSTPAWARLTTRLGRPGPGHPDDRREGPADRQGPPRPPAGRALDLRDGPRRDGADHRGRLGQAVRRLPRTRRSSGPSAWSTPAFGVPEAKRGRVATVYRTGLFGGPLVALPAYYGSDGDVLGRWRPVLDGPRLRPVRPDAPRRRRPSTGHRILKAETLAGMTRNQIGDLNVFGIFKYGFGFGLEMDRRARRRARGEPLLLGRVPSRPTSGSSPAATCSS